MDELTQNESNEKEIIITFDTLPTDDTQQEELQNQRRGLAYILSRAISTVMHPFVVPAIAIVVLLFSNTILSGIPLNLKWLFVSVILLNTLCVPVLFLLVLRTTGLIDSFSLQTTRDRIAPLAVMVVCYVVCVFMIPDTIVAFLIRKFLFAAIACVLLAFVVNFYWKISLHMVASGGALAMLMIVNISNFGTMLWPMVALVLAIGALASARLYLGSHNPAQVTVGFLGGFAVASATMLIM